jgi:hypothetical protein
MQEEIQGDASSTDAPHAPTLRAMKAKRRRAPAKYVRALNLADLRAHFRVPLHEAAERLKLS